MTTNKLWIGFGAIGILVVVISALLLILSNTLAVTAGGQETLLQSARLYVRSAFILMMVMASIAVTLGLIIRRIVVATQRQFDEDGEEQYRLSSEAAGIGAYSYELEQHMVRWSPGLKRIFGFAADEVVKLDRVLELIHSHDREHYQQRMIGKLIPLDGRPYEFEFRIVRTDGEERWLLDRGAFAFEGSGRSRHPVSARGMIVDISERKRCEELNHESELRHRAVFESTAVGMYQADASTGRLLRVNDCLCHMTGYSSTELMKMCCQEFMHPDDREFLVDGMSRLRSGKISEIRAEKRFVHKKGSLLWGDITVNLVESNGLRPIRTAAVIKDISERKQAEEKIRATERQMRSFLENSAVYGWMKDEDGRYVFLSKNYLRHLGVKLEDLLGKTDFDYWPREMAEQFRANDQIVLNTDRAFEVVERGQTSDGKQPWWLCHKFPYRDETGRRFVGGLGVDLTEHKQTEHALRESERHLALVLQGAHVGLWDWNLGTNNVHFSREWKSQLGYEEGEISDRFDEWQSRMHPDDLEPTLAQVHRFLKTPWPDYEVLFRMRHKDGTWRWILARATLIKNAHGTPERMIGIHLDITARKVVEESLRESEERLRLANEVANIGTYFADYEANRVRYSPELCEMLGVEPGIDRTLEDGFQFVQPEDLKQLRADFQAAINPAGNGRQRTEVRVIRANGEVRWIATYGLVEFRDTSSGRVPWRIIGACVDITNRKRTEETLRQFNEELEQRVAERTDVLYAKQERLQAILNNEFVAVVTCDRRGLIESVNLAAVKMFGYSVDEMIGQEFHRFVPPPPGELPSGTSQLDQELGSVRMAGRSREVVARRHDGSTFPAEMAVSNIAHLNLLCCIVRDISEQKRLERDIAEVTDYEQRRIGQDLHDSVGQQLTALTMLAQDFIESLSSTPGSDNPFPDQPIPIGTLPSRLSNLTPVQLAERLRRNLQRTLEEVRSISRSLNPVPIDSQGLMAALMDLVARTQLQSRVICTFECVHPVMIEDNVAATHLFHIAQEALSNALRHAQAREIRIVLQQDELQTLLKIQDDGRGISWPSSPRDGIGLRIMKSRADMIDATLTFDRAIPNGTIVTCTRSNGPKHSV